ncbi:MAG TPA: hypothetical protein PLD41_03995, partial [Casimicrobium huifangae]|nr:hypothetical protein [Casimicrobium huifangae]
MLAGTTATVAASLLPGAGTVLTGRRDLVIAAPMCKKKRRETAPFSAEELPRGNYFFLAAAFLAGFLAAAFLAGFLAAAF